MKKNLIYTLTAAIAFSLALISCDKEKKNGDKKLPSKIILNDDWGSTTLCLKYDDQNRLIEWVARYGDKQKQGTIFKLEYDANNRVSKMTEQSGDDDLYVYTFQYIGNNRMIFINTNTYYGGDTSYVTLNANGQITKTEDKGGSSEWTYEDGNLIQHMEVYKYEDEGEIVELSFYANYTYSDVQSVFRNATGPIWLLYLTGTQWSHVCFPPSKNMPLSTAYIEPGHDEQVLWTFTYETDPDGYVISSKMEPSLYELSAAPSKVEAPVFKAFGKSNSKVRTKIPARKNTEADEWTITLTYEYILAK